MRRPLVLLLLGAGATAAAVVAILVVVGLKLVVTRWVRKGGPRRAISDLAEDGAVKLVDALLDEVLPAA